VTRIRVDLAVYRVSARVTWRQHRPATAGENIAEVQVQPPARGPLSIMHSRSASYEHMNNGLGTETRPALPNARVAGTQANGFRRRRVARCRRPCACSYTTTRLVHYNIRRLADGERMCLACGVPGGMKLHPGHVPAAGAANAASPSRSSAAMRTDAMMAAVELARLKWKACKVCCCVPRRKLQPTTTHTAAGVPWSVLVVPG
jgi:hypothetical protein